MCGGFFDRGMTGEQDAAASPYMTCDGQDASLRDWQVRGHLGCGGDADASHGYLGRRVTQHVGGMAAT